MRLSTFIHALLAALAAASAGSTPANAIDNPHLLEFSAMPLDTRTGIAHLSSRFGPVSDHATGLRLVQFSGPVQQAWLDTLAAHGARPLQYVRNNGYLVWVDEPAAVSRLAGLRSHTSWLGFEAPMHGALKLDTLLHRRLESPGRDTNEVDIVVQVHVHDGDDESRRFIESLARLPTSQLGPVGTGVATSNWAPVLRFNNLDLRVRVADIPAIAARPDVSFVGERLPKQIYDEKQGLILSADMRPGPSSHSHLEFLLDRGFPADPAAYPVVDITDSTVQEGDTGNGVTDTQDPTLRAFGELSSPSRVVYFENCSDWPTGTVGAEDGHGTINASILAGYDLRDGWPFQDDDGQQLGLGINPFARIGSTAIFVGPGPGYNVWGCGGNDQGVIAANARRGAAISSNSWGSSSNGAYTATDQVYDAAVRNVDAGSEINRAMIYIIAAGNDGPSAGTIGSPGSAKNVITIGASENLRPVDIASQCPGDSLASASDDPQSIAAFSSRGPVAGQRVKPELIAPGTRITGSRSIHPDFAGRGVCIPSFPLEQTVFSASSGTSHSTPAVSGVASLAYWWIENGGGNHAAGTLDLVGGARAPSPALMKAWLIAHPGYLTGASAGDNLPSNQQGFGIPNMAEMFDATPKVLIDQSEILDASGERRDYLWGVEDPEAPVRLVLAWTDAPGQPGASPQVNDLDLEVVIDGVVHRGNHFLGQWSLPGGGADDRNNIEAVFLPPGIRGDITVSVIGSNIAGDGVPGNGDGTDQDFALVCINCQRQPTFTVRLDQPDLQACMGNEWRTGVHLEPLVGFDQPVTLSIDELPPGISASATPNPVSTPGHAQLRILADAGGSTGTWPVRLQGDSAIVSRSLDLGLTGYDQPPNGPANAIPADGSSDVPATPAFAWEPAEHAHTYLVQIARDPGFHDIVLSHETRSTAWTVPATSALATSSRFWWRVIARNACGDSATITDPDTVFADGFEPPSPAPAMQFTTLTLPGDCPVDVDTVTLFEDDLENGTAGWSHGAASGHTTLWSLGSDASHGGSQAWLAGAPASGAGNDAWLVSPTIALPADLTTPTLAFRNRQSIKSGAAGLCYDGALVEVSSNGGTSWSALSTPLTDPFDGTVQATFGNPLAQRQAWCGDPQAYLNSVMDLSAHSGQTVRFRFRLGHDRFPHRSGTNWAIDDIRVAACSP